MSGGLWRLLATPLAAIAAGLGVAGLSGMVLFDRWLGLLAAVVGATAAVVVLTRLATGRPFAPTIAGALAATWLMFVVFVPGADGGTTWLPTPSALGAARAVVEEAVRYSQATVAPAIVSPELAFAITGLTLILFLIVDAVAVGGGFAATAGFLLLLPWLPALTLERRVPTAALAGALAAWLALIALSRRSEGGAWRRRAQEAATPAPGAAAAATALTVALALVVAPLAIGGPGWGAMPRLTLPESLGGASRLDLDLDLRDSLTARSAVPVLAYSSTSGRIDVLRAYTFGTFDGARWDRDPEGDTVRAGGVLWPEDFPGWVGLESANVTVRVQDLSESRVPLPASPRAVTSYSDWRYDASTDELITDRPEGTQGIRYTVRQALGFHTPETLRAAESRIVAGGDDAVPGRYLDLSPRIDLERVRTVAELVTVGTQTRYDTAVALQEYLRGSGFVYDTEVSPSGDDAVSTFFEERRGYCVQFATAMVVLARSLDIPARLAVGFLGGAESGAGDFVVRGRDAHAWPELYFPGHGWVRFEPTPAQQTGERPSYAVPERTETVPIPDIRPTAVPDSTRAPTLPTAAPSVAPATAQTDGRTVPWIAILAVVLVVVAAVAAVGWARMRDAAGATSDAEQAWATLRRRLGERAGDDALTPAEAERHILDGGPELEGDARDALRRLRQAVEDHRYAPRGSASTPDELRAWVDAVASAAREAARAAQRTG